MSSEARSLAPQVILNTLHQLVFFFNLPFNTVHNVLFVHYEVKIAPGRQLYILRYTQRAFLAPKVLFDYLPPMITILPIQSHPFCPTYSSEWTKQTQGHVMQDIAEVGLHSFLENHVFLPTEQAGTKICWMVYTDINHGDHQDQGFILINLFLYWSIFQIPIWTHKNP